MGSHSSSWPNVQKSTSKQSGDPLSIRVTIQRDGKSCETSVIPDLIFGLGFPDGSRRCFMVEIDRGTMPITRTSLTQTSFERKMRSYLTIQANKVHERLFGW